MVDCSHANSGKQSARQEEVWRSIIAQRISGTRAIIGAMLESNLFEGNQPLVKDQSTLKYGISITDACVDWECTERLLRYAHKALKEHSASQRPETLASVH